MENRLQTSMPVLGRVLMTFGADSLRDSHGNRVTGNDLAGFNLHCATSDTREQMTMREIGALDAAMLRAAVRDPIGALLDNIDLGNLESPLQSLCAGRESTTPNR